MFSGKKKKTSENASGETSKASWDPACRLFAATQASNQKKKKHCVVQIAPSVIWILLQREDGLSLSLKLFLFYTDLNQSCSFVSVHLSHVFIFVPNNSFVRRHRRVPPQQRRMWPRVPEHGGQLRVQLQEGLQAADQREDLPRWAALFLVSLEQVSCR